MTAGDQLCHRLGKVAKRHDLDVVGEPRESRRQAFAEQSGPIADLAGQRAPDRRSGDRASEPVVPEAGRGNRTSRSGQLTRGCGGEMASEEMIVDQERKRHARSGSSAITASTSAA